MKKVLKALLCLLAVLLLTAAGYVVYVFTSYYRIGDHLSLAIVHPSIPQLLTQASVDPLFNVLGIASSLVELPVRNEIAALECHFLF